MYKDMHVHTHTHTHRNRSNKSSKPDCHIKSDAKRISDKIVVVVNVRADSYFFFLKNHGVPTKPTFTTPMSYLRGQGKVLL
jgi:hypothetical protein